MVTNHGPLSRDQISDLFVYSQYAQFLADGLTPYQQFEFEYPPLALVPIGLFGGDEVALSLGMLACALVAQEAARSLGGPRAAWLVALLPVLVGALVRTRFDVFPLMFALGGLALVLQRRPAWAGLVLGLGVLAKLWPGLLVLVGACWLRGREVPRLIAVAAVTVAVGTIPYFATSPEGFMDQFQFHLERPVQIESIPASVLFAVGGSQVTGDPIRTDRFKSNGLDGGAADVLTPLAALAQLGVLAFFLVAVFRRRGDPDALVLGALGAVLAFVTFGKVLSPQYLVWLVPFAAVVAARGFYVPAGAIAAAAVVGLVYFPGKYFDLVYERDGVVWLVALRNALLIAAVLATARALARRPSPSAAPRPG